MTDVREQISAALAKVGGVLEGESMFSGEVAYWVDGTEVAHFESDRAIEVRLTKDLIRERRAALKRDTRVALRPSGADWLTVHFGDSDDIAFVVDLVRDAEKAHRPPEGVAAKPPPTGAALERRKRFH